jgi:hypothetical protein
MRPPSQSRVSSLVKDAQTNSQPGLIFRTFRGVNLPLQEQDLETARRTLAQARKEAQLALQKYTSLLEAERRAQSTLAIAEERRGELSELFSLQLFDFVLKDVVASFVDFYNSSNNACKSPSPFFVSIWLNFLSSDRWFSDSR